MLFQLGWTVEANWAVPCLFRPNYGLWPDLESYNTLMKGFVRQKHWQGALQVLQMIRAARMAPDVVSHTTAIAACGQQLLWREAVHLCDEMRLNDVRPDVVTFGAVIGACADGSEGGWALALSLFQEAQSEGVAMSTPCLNNALQACVMASYWQSSLTLAEELNTMPDPVSSNIQLAALTVSHHWMQALHMLQHDFPQRGHRFDPSTYNSARLDDEELFSLQGPGLESFRAHALRCFLESDDGRRPFRRPAKAHAMYVLRVIDISS